MNILNNLWIGLVQLSSKPGNGLLDKSKGAYVNVLAFALDEDDFTNKVKKTVQDMGLEFVHIEDVELFSERCLNYEINDYIINLAIEVRETKELKFGTFHTFNV